MICTVLTDCSDFDRVILRGRQDLAVGDGGLVDLVRVPDGRVEVVDEVVDVLAGDPAAVAVLAELALVGAENDVVPAVVVVQDGHRTDACRRGNNAFDSKLPSQNLKNGDKDSSKIVLKIQSAQ